MKKFLPLIFIAISLKGFAQSNTYGSATDINSLLNTCSGNQAYTTAGSTADQSALSCSWSGSTVNNNVWFKFQATSTGFIKIQVNTGASEGTLAESVVGLWSSGPTELKCISGSGSNDVEISKPGLVNGTWYYISVDNYYPWSSDGTFTICLSDVPTYDFKTGALSVNNLLNSCSNDAEFTTIGATSEGTPAPSCGSGPNNDVWFSFTGTSSGFINIQLFTGGSEGTLGEPALTLWNSSFAELKCTCTGAADIEINYSSISNGSTYYISVDNRYSYSTDGSFKLCLNNQPAYDFLGGANDITDVDSYCSSDAEFTTVGATADQTSYISSCGPNPPTYNRWFKFKAVTNTVTFQAKTGGSFGTLNGGKVTLWSYNGSALTELKCGNTNVALTYGPTPALAVGTNYYISVDNQYSWDQGTFTLCVNNTSSSKYYAIANANWNLGTTWSFTDGGAAAGFYPQNGNAAYIKGYTVTATGAEACSGLYLTIQNGATQLVVEGSSGGSVTNNGKLTMTNSGQNQNGIITIQNGGALTTLGNATFTRGGGSSSFQLNLTGTGSSMTVGKSMTWSSTAGSGNASEINISGSSTLSVSNDINLSYTGGMSINYTLSGTGILSAGRDISFSSNAAGFELITLNSGTTLKIGRNFVRAASPSTFGKIVGNSGSTVEFTGTNSSQKFPDLAGNTDNFTFDGIKINNNYSLADEVALSVAATITGNLTCNAGKLKTTSSKILTIGANGSASAGSASAYVDGPLNHTVNVSTPVTKVFPVGKNGYYHQIDITIDQNAATTTKYTAEAIASSATALNYNVPVGLAYVSGISYWNVTPEATGVGYDGNSIKIYYQGNDGVTDCANLGIAKTLNNDGNWYDISPASNPGCSNPSGNITSTSFTTFSKFALANKTGGANPLPVEWIYFNATQDNSVVKVEWVTASELNSDYFTVLRGETPFSFDSIATVKAAGQSSVQKFYDAIDTKPISGKSYYRIKETDINGQSTFSNTISVNFQGIEIISTQPNPAVKNIVFVVNTSEDMKADYSVYNTQGRPIVSGKYFFSKGLTYLDLDVSSYSQSVYILRIVSDDNKYRVKKHFVVASKN